MALAKAARASNWKDKLGLARVQPFCGLCVVGLSHYVGCGP